MTNQVVKVQDSCPWFQPYEAVLGQGYSGDTNMPAAYGCFNNGTIQKIGGGSSVIHFDSSVSFHEMESSLNVDVSAKVGIGPFSASASADYSRFIKDDDYSYSAYYYEKVILQTESWNPPGFGPDKMLNDIGKGNYNKTDGSFRIYCGDQIYTQKHQGIALYVAMKMHFASHYEKTLFSSKVSANFGDIVSASAQVQKITSEYSMNGDVEVSAFQQGGDPAQLPNIFEKKGDNYYVTQCSFSDIEACHQTINGVLDYARTNLPNQTQGTTTLGWATGGLSALGVDPGPSVVNSTVEEAREFLGSSYQNQSRYSIFLDHVTGGSYSGYIKILPELKSEDGAVKENVAVLCNPDKGVPSCYKMPKNCIEVAQTIKSELQDTPVTLSYINTPGFSVDATGKSGSGLTCNCHQYDRSLNANALLVPTNSSPVSTYVSVPSGKVPQKLSVVTVNQMGDALSVTWNKCTSNVTKLDEPANTYEVGLGKSNPCVNDYIENYECGQELTCPRGCQSPVPRYCSGTLDFTELDSPGL